MLAVTTLLVLAATVAAAFTLAHSGHTYAMIVGLRWDTSGPGQSGARWRPEKRSSEGFVARHYPGL